MAEPVDLGPRTATGAADSANPLGAGNWSVKFPPGNLGVQVIYEIYKMVIAGPGGFLEVYKSGQLWDTTLLATQNSWDPSQPLLMRPGDDLVFYWSIATGSAPKVTLWLRYTPPL